MKINLNFDKTQYDAKLFKRPPTDEQWGEYSIKLTEWSKEKVGDQPAAPDNGEMSTQELAILVAKQAINDLYEVGKTGQLRQLIRLGKDLDDQKTASELLLPEDDVAFIRKAIGKKDWPAKQEALRRFIIAVEDAFSPNK